MIRSTLLWMYVLGFSGYAFKDWYKSLCALILLMAVVEHPDMPKSLMGIQGLNPWNIMLAVVFVAWLRSRAREGLEWDMPSDIKRLLSIYLAVLLVSFLRLILDLEGLAYQFSLYNVPLDSIASLISEHIINCIKWVIPGLMLFDGCRDRRRFNLAMISFLGVYFLLAVQVIRWMPLSSAISGSGLADRSIKILMNEIGYHRVNLSTMLSGASWAIFCARVLAPKHNIRTIVMIMLCALTVLFGQALTGGRAGYGTWAVVGLILCLTRWRRYLLLAPLGVVLLLMFVPGVYERLTEGFTKDSHDTASAAINMDAYRRGNADLYTVTAGRVVAWPYVIDKISEAPFIGHGKEAMIRTGVTRFLWVEFAESFPHPHNAYLQLLLDTGLLGFVPIMIFYGRMVKYSWSLFRDSRDDLFQAIGGASLSLLLALLVASMGSQTFYPREGSVGMWCAMMLMLRIHLMRRKVEENMDRETAKGKFDLFKLHAEFASKKR